jgi:hypothetical protein
LSKERGRETRHARKHASLHVAGGTYQRLVRACAGRYVATRIPTDARAPAPSLLCGPQDTLSVQQPIVDLRASLTRAHYSDRLHRSEGHVCGEFCASYVCPACVLACACPRDLSLVCRADNFFWTTTNSPPQRVVTPPRKEGLTPLTLPVCHRCTARQETLVGGLVGLGGDLRLARPVHRLARPVHQVSLPLARVSAQHVHDSAV